MKPYVVIVEDSKLPLGEFLMAHVPFLSSKASVKKSLSRKLVHLNGEHPGFFSELKRGDRVEVYRTDRRAPKPKFDISIPIVYQDEHCLVVQKPGGIAVNGNRHKTVENIIQHSVPQSSVPDALPYPRPVHRLDVPTSGLVMMARSKSFQVKLGQDLQRKRVTKHYVAIVHGQIKAPCTIDRPLEGKPCQSIVTPIEVVPSINFGHLTMVRLEPVTGRTHQLRKHLLMIGHPIAGDKMYNTETYVLQGKGMCLCAMSLEFDHPIDRKRVKVEIGIPEKFSRIMAREKQYFEKNQK